MREPWHAIDVDGVVRRLGSARAGLSSQESERRLARYGPNRLPEPPRAGLARIHARQFASPLIYLLLAASLVSLAIGEHTDAAFIFAVLQLNALFGAFHEWKAETSASALAQLTRSTATVWRDGRKRSIDSALIVPGDLVDLASGDRIPADVRLHEDAEVLSGTDFARLIDGVDPEGGSVPPGVLRRVADTRIFACTEPLQKLAIVRLLKRAGHFVAVTGDGVNDAPALDAAEIGVAMGRSGTDVARNAAGLLLVDDNFASIVKGIEQGRIAYDNIRKVALLLLATGAGEIVLFALALGAGLPIPLLPVQLLWLNLVTNGIQDVALAFEGGEPAVIRRPPRPPSQPLIDRPMLVQIALGGGYMGVVGSGFYHWALGSGYDEVQARTGLLLLMEFFENVHVFNCRSETRSMLTQPLSANPLVVLNVIATLALHLFATWTSGCGAILHVVAPEPALVAVAVPLALGLALLFEGYKWLVGRRR